MWTNAEKRRLAEGLSRPDVLTRPYHGHPFGRVQNREELHQFFLSGEAEPGKLFQRGHRATENQVSRMLREDFAPLSDDIPDHENHDLYPDEEESEAQQTENAAQSKPQDVDDVDEDKETATDDGEEQANNGMPNNDNDIPEWAAPSEEHSRQVEEYYKWITYREELPDKRFPWEDEEPAEEDENQDQSVAGDGEINNDESAGLAEQ
ncbi:hypothetical protein PG995_004994 [Apiospora arundinis]